MAASYRVSAPNQPGVCYFVPSQRLMSDPDSSEHIAKLYEANNAFRQNAMDTSAFHGEYERLYHELYQDIIENEDFWFDRVFPNSSDYCEWTVGILGTLATIRRQRGDVEKCLEILELDTRLLQLYLSLVDHSIPGEHNCARGLTYKYNLIVINANCQIKKKEPALKAFREAVTYEIEEGFTFDQQNFAFFLKRNLEDDYMNLEYLNETPDDFIWSVMMTAHDMCPANGRSDLRVDPWVCDGCGATEDLCGDFKQCAGCKKAKYCSKECQVRHWKKYHKQDCKNGKKKNNKFKIKVSNGTLKSVANLLIDNYATTVKLHADEEVTEEQKRAAFPGLVQLFRDAVKRRPEFNSDVGFQDGARDAEFNEWLQNYFEKQPGYGALEWIHKKPEVVAYQAAIVSPEKSGELRVDEDTITDMVKRFVAQLHTSLFMVITITDGQKQQLIKQLAQAVTQYILDHPECNSYKGFEDFKYTQDARDVVLEACTQFLEEEGLVADD